MKKLIAILTVFGIVSCTNPSMEDGLAKMDSALANLAAAIESLNIPQMEADLAQMNQDAAQMLADIESMDQNWDEAIAQLNQLSTLLDGILADSSNWATTEQMQGLLAQVQQFGEGIDLLVLQADYDYDGVINAIDQCPDTPIMQINNVNAQGCAPDETPTTGN